MKLIADLHIHSRYSRATSPRLNPACLERWARIKGLDILGTGDCTHPQWLAELKENLEETEPGLYTLKAEVREQFDKTTALVDELPPAPAGSKPRFVLTGEISTIYKKAVGGGEPRTRKVHHVVILPNFEAAEKFQAKLAEVGNIHSDGRPILGLDSHDLFALLLDAAPGALLVPAHIWTPWFSALGAKSGFDSIDACYGDLAPEIHAIETGLSSNPPMNWAVPSLNRFNIISNSDAHSPDKLGRESTIFDLGLPDSGALSFENLAAAINAPFGAVNNKVLGTIEFFPQEGKYHYDGHRKCNKYLSPEEASRVKFSARGEALCPVCGKPLTRGVMGRVMQLAAEEGGTAIVDEFAPNPLPEVIATTNRKPYYSLIPLTEILGEIIGTGPASKKVSAAYDALIAKAGSEINILMDMPFDSIMLLHAPAIDSEQLVKAISNMREGKVSIRPGYDGNYGVIHALPEKEKIKPAVRAGDLYKVPHKLKPVLQPEIKLEAGTYTPTAEQQAVISSNARHALIIAGPGSGKTATLAARIAALVGQGFDPGSILALSFTVKAARELGERIALSLNDRTDLKIKNAVTSATFHSLCAGILREQAAACGLASDFSIISDDDRDKLLQDICSGTKTTPRKLGRYIEERKRYLLLPGEKTAPLRLPGTNSGQLQAEIPRLDASLDASLDALYALYRKQLHAKKMLDFDDLVTSTVRFFALKPAICGAYQQRYRAIFVDEYQDLNYAQYALIRLLSYTSAQAGPSQNDGPMLWVIGDPAQAIYGFRGADKRFIEQFALDYPDAARFTLSRSFRCAAAITRASNAVCTETSAYAGGFGGKVIQGTDDEALLYRASFPSAASEAEGIARRIAALTGGTSFFAEDSGASGFGNLAPDDCAVLLRTLRLAGPVTEALNNHGIPYVLQNDESRRIDAAPYSVGGVHIMSIHAAKGLEFSQVFIPALEEGILPFSLFGDCDVNEEKRILYVAMTRAKNGLYLSWAKKRSWTAGNSSKPRLLELPPSPFLEKLEELVPLREAGRRRQKKEESLQPALF